MNNVEHQYELRELFDNSPIGIAVVSRQSNKRLFVNKRLVAMFGATNQRELLSHGIEESWVVAEELFKTRDMLANDQHLVNFKAERRRLDGSQWWAQMNTQFINFEGESARAIWHVDISNLQKAEEVIKTAHIDLEKRVVERTEGLLKSEQRFRDFAEVSSDWFWEMDLDLRYTFVSVAYEEIAGKKVETILGRTRREMYKGMVEEEAYAWAELLDSLDRHEDFEDFTYSYIRPDGKTRVMSNNGRAIFDDHGVFTGYRGMGVDITELYKAQQAVKTSEELYRRLFKRDQTIVNSLPDILFVLDEHGHYVEVITDENDLFYAEKSMMLGKSMFEILPEDVAINLHAGIREALKNDELTILEYQLDVAAGARNFEARITPLPDTDSDERQVLYICRDITERIEADKAKSEFTATMNHELRTPLTSIKGALGLVQSGVAGTLTGTSKSMIDIAYVNCNRMVTLVDDIFDIGKIESGKMLSSMEAMNIVPVIAEAIEVAENFTDQYGVNFIDATDVGVQKEILINGDKKRLMQVLRSLMSNAAKFSPKGETIKLSITCDDQSVCIAIKDKGVGVPAKLRDSIFTKFTQADSSDTRRAGGTGLGLSISQAIVKQHGGEIDFESSGDAGSNFFFTLPVVHLPQTS